MGKFADFFEESGTAKKYWNSSRLGVPLWLILAAVTVYWYCRVPSPGYAIGALAVVAGIMSVREMKVLGKIAWVVLLICMLVTEFRAIDKDRKDAEDKQIADRKVIDDAFGEVLRKQDGDFKATAGRLQVAIDGIKSTLATANTTLRQTQPHATMRLDRVEFKPVPSEIKADTQYTFNYSYVNSGSETAADIVVLDKVYVAVADDRDAEKDLGL
jgi:hypothetical protein